jgi:GMP synthase-like glutamine amidotransferase
MPPVAIFRFSPTEGPAYFAEWLTRHGLASRIIALDAGASVPADPRAFAGIALMGGPMGANDALPWIEPVCALLRAAVGEKVPVLGHCLGGQLFAKALGAKVARAPVHEIGWIDVESTDADAQAAWFGGRPRFTGFQWHYDAFAVPANAKAVLTNRFNANQAYIVDDRHIGLQCHIEMTRDLVETWLASGASELPSTSNASAQSATDIRRNMEARLAALHAVADDVYARWAQGLIP